MPDKNSSNYNNSNPSDQNALNIFKEEWSSKFPETFKLSTSGEADLFEDQRILWAEEHGIVFRNKEVLELGPLEAGHTWMMDQRGTRSIIAVEAHERAYLKSLIIKEITQIKSARFLHGDFELYLKKISKTFDICLASGVLYHSKNPVELLHNICKRCNQLILWTHYYDEKVMKAKDSSFSDRFNQTETFNYQGESINLHPFQYKNEAATNAFCGGLNNNSIWLERKGIETILEKNNFQITAIGFDHPNHPKGPAFALLAELI